MNNPYLAKPSTQFQDEYLSFYQEWVNSGEDLIPWVISKDPSDFQSMLKFIFENENGTNLPYGWIPSSTYWLVDDPKKVIGVVNIRHRLTQDLVNVGGHIGYGIRPSERQKGYAAKLLQLSLIKARALGVERALLTCDETNVGSEKTIRKNGGVQDSDYVDYNDRVTHRFWIVT